MKKSKVFIKHKSHLGKRAELRKILKRESLLVRKNSIEFLQAIDALHAEDRPGSWIALKNTKDIRRLIKK